MTDKERKYPASAIKGMQEKGKEPIQRLERVAKAYVGDLKYAAMSRTRHCLVCNKAENENAVYINEAAAWLCPVCRGKLLELMEKEAET